MVKEGAEAEKEAVAPIVIRHSRRGDGYDVQEGKGCAREMTSQLNKKI